MAYRHPAFCGGMSRDHGIAWFRVAGYGVWIRWKMLHPPLFSERYRKGTWRVAYTVGPVTLRPLTRTGI